jgi:glycosyltransferase involved in cell wall biosynthesis
MKSGVVSIIMPVYNGAEYLAGAIESVLAQSYPQWELVLVDDGSTDETAVIVQQFNDARIRYHYQENRGQAAALNTGLSLAQGEFVTTLDADDSYSPESLQSRVTLLNQHPEIEIVYGDGFYCYESGEPFLRFTEYMPTGVTGDVYDTLIVSPFYGTGATVMIRRQLLLDRQVGYDETIVWCQDWDFYIRLAETARFGFVEANTIYYRMHGAGMTVAMPHGRRLESLIRTRQKVMASARFLATADEQKAAFFYDFLMQDLLDNTTAQDELFASSPFRSLSFAQQSRLLRVAAIHYLRQQEQTAVARRWLRRAWAAAPFEAKTAVITLSSHLSLRLTRRIIDSWQGRRPLQPLVSPFEMALSPSAQQAE